MKVLLPVFITALFALVLMNCSEPVDNSHEIERLTAEAEALKAEVAQYEGTVERLEGEVRSLMTENADLKNQLEIVSLDLEGAKNARNTGFVERVVERPARDFDESETSAQTGQPINPIDEDTGLQVLRASARATEKNKSWWRFGWTVTIANHSSETRDFRLQVQFMDADGFVVDDDTEHGLTIPAGQSKTFRDSDLIDATVARRVKSVNPVIRY